MTTIGDLPFPGYVFGQPYARSAWYKIIFGRLGFNFRGILFVTKTVTLPGLVEMRQHKKWQDRDDVFQISISLMKDTLIEKRIEIKEICHILNKQMPFGPAHWYALQINLPSPTGGREQIKEERMLIEILKAFKQYLPKVPLIAKFDFIITPLMIKKLRRYCDAFCIGIPGEPFFPVGKNWLECIQRIDPSVSIIGAGIMRKKDIKQLCRFPIIKAVMIDSVAILRPWRVQGLIKYGNRIFSKRVLPVYIKVLEAA